MTLEMEEYDILHLSVVKNGLSPLLPTDLPALQELSACQTLQVSKLTPGA